MHGKVAPQVAVCGPRNCTEQDKRNAFEVGRLLAISGAIVICGGGIGVMAAVSAGARSAHGLVIGIRPGDSSAGANPDLSAVIVTNIGEARNAVIVWSADAVIAVGGSWGTLSEVALAKRRGGIPVITLGGWKILDSSGQPVEDPVTCAADPAEAVDLAIGSANPR
jgi:uncharacterized protein (TIGR00725 family)